MGEKTFKIVGGDLSDGYHTFDELYEHRCFLFINLCLAYPELAWWKPHYEGWPALFLELPTGQISYHVPDRLLPLFQGKIVQNNGMWDGHTGADVLKRLAEFAEAKPGAGGGG